jgi:NHL repeat-containing protein
MGAHTVFRFREDGTYLGKVGTTPAGSPLTTPTGIAVDRFGNAWVAEQSADKVLEFDSSGNYVFSFGGTGTGNGQFQDPTGIALAPSGNLLVLDGTNNRVQEFKPDGTYLRQFGALGTGNAQFTEPRGLAVGAGNALYVADAGNHRIARWSHADLDPQSGVAEVEVKVDGTTAMSNTPACGTKNCQLSGSWTMKADEYPGGPHKVEVIATDGVGLTTTKTLDVETHGDDAAPTVALTGSMTQQESLGNTLPRYKLVINATDPGSAEERKSGVASTTIKVDGKTVDTTSPGCPSEGCSITREWTLESSSYSAGAHNVEVVATDAAGHTTTKTLAITINRDVTAPVLVSGEEQLFTAPKGWLEQKSYFYAASSADANGYGVTALELKIDGAVVKKTSGTCPNGNCTKTLFGYADMSNYQGGAHQAELIATDGAGNAKHKTWTINVDPDGAISTDEMEATLEAVETTTTETPVAPPAQLLEPEQLEGGDNPGLQQVGSIITSSGVPDTLKMTTDPEAGFTIESPYGQTHITPSVAETASETAIAEGVAGVSANVAAEADSVLRPEFNGLQSFQAIRSDSSPTKYSWTVHLYDGETLKAVNDAQAEVSYEDGKLAFLITAEPAHDATGKEVPTSIEVSGNVLTLNVEFHDGGFVFPIVAGAGWETAYKVPVVVQGPEDETQIREREEQEAAEAGEGEIPPAPEQPISPEEAEWLVRAGSGGDTDVEAPPYPCKTCATASKVREFVVEEQHVCQIWHCGIWKVWIAGGKESEQPHFLRYYNWAEWVNGTGVRCGYHYDTAYALTGLMVHEEGCGFAGPWQVWKGNGKHLTVWTRHTIEVPVITDVVQEAFTNHLALLIWVWPNGYQEKVVRSFDPGIEE